MKTQISRNSHHNNKRYSGVYQQQGRMLTDADWNEMVDLLKGLLAESLVDVVGNGSPRAGAVTITGDRRIKPGDLYGDGVRAELLGNADIAADQQPDLPEYTPLPATGPYIVYADVWERSVTSLEDAGLRDAGLYGADTCTRTQTMLQIKWRPKEIVRRSLPQKGNVLLSLDLHSNLEAGDPCDPCAGLVTAGEGRVGNYLFRLEVHAVKGSADNPKEIALKWSSENGAEQFKAMDKGKMPPGFVSEKYVYEFFDETSEKHLGVHLAAGFTPTTGVLKEYYEIPKGNSEPKEFVRRWDGYCRLKRSGTNWSLKEGGQDKGTGLSTTVAPTAHGHVSLKNDFIANLEALKLTLKITIAVRENTFVAGDYWLAPVREKIHSPGSKIVSGIEPEGIVHHYLRLAGVDAGGTVHPFLDDADRRRHRFPPLTDIRAHDVGYKTDCDSGLFDAGHDNVKKALDRLCELAAEHIAYQADCSDGLFKNFVGTVKQALDRICEIQAQHVGFTKPCDTSLYQGQTVSTVQDALALLCAIRADYVSFTAKPECALLNQSGINTVQDAIDALCLRPSRGGCRQVVASGESLMEVINKLLEEGRKDICLCLLPGDHEIPDGLEIKDADLHINISGCGSNTTRISLGNNLLAEVHSFSLSGVHVGVETPAAGLSFTGCQELTLESNHLIGFTEESALVTLDASSRIHLADNTIEAYNVNTFEMPRKIFEPFEDIRALFGIVERTAFITQTRSIANGLAALNADARQEMINRLRERVQAHSTDLSELELASYEMFGMALSEEKSDAGLLASALYRVRRFATVTRPATAVTILTARAATILENNDIEGFLSFYGLPAEKSLTDDELEALQERVKDLKFVPSQNNLQLRNNRLIRVVISQEMIEIIRSFISNDKGELRGIFDTALLTDNIIELPDNHFIARGHSLTSTRFDFGLINADAGFVLGENAVYVGSYARDDFRLFSLTQAATEAATLGLNIVGV